MNLREAIISGKCYKAISKQTEIHHDTMNWFVIKWDRLFTTEDFQDSYQSSQEWIS